MTEIVTVQTVQTVRDLRRRWKPHKERLLAAAAGIVGAALLAGAAAAQDRPVAAVSTPAHHGNRLLPEDFHLLGGWRVAMPFCGGGLAIDSKNKRFFTNGFGSADEIMEFSLMQPNPKTGAVEEVKMGKGDNVAKWPRLDPVKKYTRFWEGGYAGGLFYEDNCLWVSPRKFYDTSPPLEFSLYGKDLTTGEVKTKLVKLPRAAFGGGFVKAKGGKLANTLLGCGGYESGQGSVAGPTLATADGKILINQKNHGTSEFSQRELRPANYWPKDHENGWMALEPQNGVGRWACDRIHAGGIWTPRGICYWPLLGVGDIDYQRQSETFGASTETWLYTYDPKTYDKVEFNLWKYGHVQGQEMGPDGLVYLLVRNMWQSALYKVDSVIMVFDIGEKASSIRASGQRSTAKPTSW